MKRSRGLGNPFVGIAAALCVLFSSSGPLAADSAATKRDDLLIGYNLLSGAMSAKGQLKYLLWLRELMLQGPSKEVERLMTTIYETSNKRVDELDKLRKLAPVATAKPPPSPIGSAIEAAAKWDGTKELLFPDGEFGMRFVFLQAQTTRMISVIAEQTAKIDPNVERKQWLENVGKEYEAFREELVVAVEKCEPR